MKTRLLVFILTILYTSSHAQTILVNDFPISELKGQYVLSPSMAVGSDGRFGVSWGDHRNGINGTGDGIGRIYSQLYTSTGAAATNTNSYTDNITYGVAYDNFYIQRSAGCFTAANNYVVAWQVDGFSQLGIYTEDVYFSSFNTLGQRTLAGVQLNLNSNGAAAGYGTNPSIALTSSNQLVAAYEYSNFNGAEIAVTSIDATTGNTIGGSAKINDSNTSARKYPKIASNGSQTVVTWTDARADAFGDIYIQRFVGNNAAGANQLVNDNAGNSYNQLSNVAMNALGEFVVVWLDTRTTSKGDVYAQKYNANGMKVGTNIKLTNSNAELFACIPGVALFDNGNMAICWVDSLPNNKFTCKYRGYTAQGQPINLNPIELTSNNNFISGYPDLKISPSGNMYFCWIDGRDGNLGRIYGKIISGYGTATGNEQQEAEHFQVYPNPFTESFFVREINDEIESINVYDARGKHIKNLPINELSISKRQEYRFEDLAPGMYVLQVVQGGSTKSLKLLKN